MNKNFIKSPVISELYSQKLIHSAHLKKLQDIKNNRKTQLSLDKNRTHLINSIRQHKAYTFAVNYNQDHDQITSQNTKIIKKLTSAKPTSVCQQKLYHTEQDHKITLSSRSRFSFTEVQRERQLQKENNRLYMKLRTASSNLKSDKFKVEHQKAQRIKQRIMRYSYDANDPTKIGLKSQKLISLRHSYLSNKPIETQSRRESKSVQMKRKGTAQYYEKSQIINNTLQNINKRFVTVNQSLKHNKSTENQEDKTFLTAQNNTQASRQQKASLNVNKNKISFLKENLKAKKLLSNQALKTPIIGNKRQKLEEIKLKSFMKSQK